MPAPQTYPRCHTTTPALTVTLHVKSSTLSPLPAEVSTNISDYNTFSLTPNRPLGHPSVRSQCCLQLKHLPLPLLQCCWYWGCFLQLALQDPLAPPHCGRCSLPPLFPAHPVDVSPVAPAGICFTSDILVFHNNFSTSITCTLFDIDFICFFFVSLSESIQQYLLQKLVF